MALTENKRWTVVLGPVKKEIIWITSDGTNDDTLATLLQNPEAVTIKSASTDLTGTADPASATFSGKTVTLRDPAASTDYVIEVWGY